MATATKISRKDDDLISGTESARLCEAFRKARKDMQVFRQNRREAIQEYVGFNWSEDGSKDRIMAPMVELAVTIYTLQLAANAPRVHCSAINRQLKPFAADLEHAINKWISQSDLEAQFQASATDALFLLGCIKTGLKEAGYVELGGERILVGDPFAQAVDYDDLVLDMDASKWSDIDFIGDCYRLPIDAVKASPLYDRRVTKTLQAAGDDDGHWEDGDEKVEEMSRTSGGHRRGFTDKVLLWDLYLPKKGLILTFPDPHEEKDWERPMRIARTTRNPYHTLSFFGVPNNITPLPPMAHWMDLHHTANVLLRKSFRQAERAKTVTGVQGGADRDGNRVLKAVDGEMIRLDNPQGVADFRVGGVDQAVLASGIMAKDLFSYFAGNLDSLGGLSPQAQTATQDQLISTSASKRLSFMQKKMGAHALAVVKDIGRFLFSDPLTKIRIVKGVRGVEGYELETEYNIDSQKGDFLDYEIRVDVHSMPLQTPQMKAASLMQIAQGLLIPMAPVLAQQGQALDMRALVKKLGKLMNIEDELADIVIDSRGPEPTERGATSHERTLPAATQRTYERVNRPGATQQQKDQMMMGMMFGQKRQGSEQATMMRAAG